MKSLKVFTVLIISQVILACVYGLSIHKIKNQHRLTEKRDYDLGSSNMVLDLSAELPAIPSTNIQRIKEYSVIQKFLLEKKPLGML
jgi:hypothetical protein